MLQLKIEEADIPLIVDRLELYRVRGGTAFAAFLTQLNTVREGSMAMTRTFEKLGDSCASASEAGAVIQTLADRSDALSEALTGALAALDPAALRREIAQAQQSLDKLGPQSRRLSAVASFSAISSASVGGGGLSEHVALLRELSVSLKADCRVVMAHLSEVREALQTSCAYITQGTLVLDKLSHQLTQRIGSAGEGQVLTQLSTSTLATSTKMLERTREHMRQLIGHMQFSDAYSQRLEHIITMVGDEMPGGGPIATAQVQHLARDQNAVQTDMSQALRGLEHICKDAATTLGQNGFSTEATSAIDACNTALMVAVNAGNQIEDTVAEAGTRLSVIGEACESAKSKFAALRSVLAQLDTSAINVTLKSRTAGDGHKVLRTLATEVHDIAMETGQSIRVVEQHLNTIGALSQADIYGPLTQELAEFKEVAATCGDLKTQVNSIREDGEAVVARGSALKKEIHLASLAIEPVGEITEMLEREALALAQWSDDHPDPDASENAAVFDLYTMERERVIHNLVFEYVKPQAKKPDERADTEADDDDFEMF